MIGGERPLCGGAFLIPVPTSYCQGGKWGGMIGSMSLKQLALPLVIDTSTADMAGEFYVL